MAVLLLSGDLTVFARVDGAARPRGKSVAAAPNAERLLALAGEDEVEAVIIDLSAPGVALDSMVQSLKSRMNAVPRIIAFGPHVHEQRLRAARDAGCDEVMSRVQFFTQIDTLLEDR
jgi:DNA-binding response OmpR family regulator